jgi:hypothetical protein
MVAIGGILWVKAISSFFPSFEMKELQPGGPCFSYGGQQFESCLDAFSPNRVYLGDLTVHTDSIMVLCWKGSSHASPAS